MTKARDTKVAIPDLFPEPKDLQTAPGEARLSRDVPLKTSGVSPAQRRAVQAILATAGVKAVPAGKGGVIEARIEAVGNFAMKEVPDLGRRSITNWRSATRPPPCALRRPPGCCGPRRLLPRSIGRRRVASGSPTSPCATGL